MIHPPFEGIWHRPPSARSQRAVGEAWLGDGAPLGSWLTAPGRLNEATALLTTPW